MDIRQFVDEGLGNSTHLAVARGAGVAALIDPPRDVDRYLEAAGHLGRARHVEAGAIAGADLSLPAGTPVATHCEHGQRSATALSVLERRGFGGLRLILDGPRDWQQAGGPIVQEGRDGAAPGPA